MILTTAVAVVLVRDTLLFDIVNQFYVPLLNGCSGGDVAVDLSGTLVHG